MTRDTLLEVSDLTVRFKTGRRFLTAVDHVSLDVTRGETFGLVGESGSGKSTFGLTVMRAHAPDAGQIVFDGTDISTLSDKEMRPYRTHMQMIFQDPYASLDPHMKVSAILAEPLRIHRIVPKAQISEKVTSLLEAVGMPAEAAQRYPSQFSGGQRQRISIARALAVEPELLIADEPVSALDVSIQAQVMALLNDVKSRFGLTTIVIAHDLALVYQVTDRIAVMYLGQIVELGPTAEVVFGPQHPYTAALLSATPMPDPEVERSRERIVLRGEPPSALSPPSGCRFHTRCPIAQDVCSDTPPPLTEASQGHLVACHFAGQIGPVAIDLPRSVDP
jgi:oligopeptide/dipeptide ABC transporter ATP-binding protein